MGYASPNRLKNDPRNNFFKLHGCSDSDSGLLITAVDCTGHGVPGAFMSMIGFNLLDTITRSGIISPNLVMNDLHRYVRYLLKQQTTDNQDGMDMSFCHITNKGKVVQFAGAKNPVYYITNGELMHLKGDSLPIGGMQKEGKREFTLHTIEVNEPTTFYMFSDGFIDQFGGLHGQKFTSRRFKELLLEIHSLPMAKQREILDLKITEWMGDRFRQIDDILVIGFKLGGDNIDI
jgi:serine phosphatase RsbU (regulator of sigma subunit)